MNRSRRMVFLGAQAFARLGSGVLVIDLHGTGDSAGDFGEADWQMWRADLMAAIDWIRARGGVRLTLWGLRLGCALAVDVARSSAIPLERLLLWQPVASGKTHLTQFLRLRVAAQAFAGGPAESVQSLRDLLASGTSLEVAGYRLQPALAAAIDAVELNKASPLSGPSVRCFDVMESAEPTSRNAPGKQVVEAWIRSGVDVSYRLVEGHRFWQTQESTTAPNLIAASSAELG